MRRIFVTARSGVYTCDILPVYSMCAQGVMYGSIIAMLSLWAPPLERSKLSTFIYAGN